MPNFTQQGLDNGKIIQDETHIWELIAQDSMKFFPHTPFTEASLLIFQNAAHSKIA